MLDTIFGLIAGFATCICFGHYVLNKKYVPLVIACTVIALWFVVKVVQL